MNPLTVSAVSFAGLFAFICAAWELTVGRRDRHGRRLLARVGIKGERAGSPASPAEAWHLRFWRSAKKALSASSPARPEWTDRWLVPSILAGGLIGAYGTFHVLRALGNAHPAGILAGAAAGAGAGWALCRRWQRQWWHGHPRQSRSD